MPEFSKVPGFNFELPADDIDDVEYYFFNLFVTDDIISDITYHTNLYADQFINKKKENDEKLSSRVTRWPEEGISDEKMKCFIALTYLMGLAKKRDYNLYWSTDSVICTPIFSQVMPRDDFQNILSFLHCSDNSTYIRKGLHGYDPRKKLGSLFDAFCSHYIIKLSII